MSVAVAVVGRTEAAIAVSRPAPASPDECLGEMTRGPAFMRSVDNPNVQAFAERYDVENECSGCGRLPHEGCRCERGESRDERVQEVGLLVQPPARSRELLPLQPLRPTPDLIEVFKSKPMPLMLERPKETAMVIEEPVDANWERFSDGRPVETRKVWVPEPVEDLPPVLAGVVAELDAEILRLQSARDRLTEALA
jgi:hypothetical protein